MSGTKEWLIHVPAPRPLRVGEQWNVFLSYRSANRSWVLNLYDVLRRYGHKVFLDQCVLVAGDQLIARLENALATSQTGILIWSSQARDSEWVSREYQTMERAAKSRDTFRFVPIRVDDRDLPPFACLRMFLDFSGYPDGPNGGELLRLLHAVVGQPMSEAAVRFALDLDEASMQAANRIGAAIRDGRGERIQELFSERGLPWRVSAALGCKAAEGLTKIGAYAAAIEMLLELEREFPRAIRPKQLRALALLRLSREGGLLKDLFAAQEIVSELYEAGEKDPETIGIYASTWMERYQRSQQIEDLRQSRDLYAEAFRAAADDYYAGVNAAAKSIMLGAPEDLEQAALLAAKVQDIVGTEPHERDYWMTATVAEVQLMKRNYSEAGRIYAAAVAMARTQTGSHKASWRQACDLLSKLQASPEERQCVRRAFAHLAEGERDRSQASLTGQA